ncbi:hypothetical protein ACI78Q_06045 [Geodermatophilus sp. SYSU D00705]
MLTWLPDISAWTPEDWSAFGTNITAVIAVLAGIVAWRQLREARRLRTEQAQPYVVCYAEVAPGHDTAVDIVIRNFGTTLARGITVTVTPPILRSGRPGEEPEEVHLPARLPALVPGQAWRTLWDLAPRRAKSSRPISGLHEVIVSYSDSHGKALPPTPSVLDWEDFGQRTMLVTHGVHEAATALRDLSRTVAGFKYRSSGGLSVHMHDADEAERQEREDFERFRQEVEQDRLEKATEQPGHELPEPPSTEGPRTSDRVDPSSA